MDTTFFCSLDTVERFQRPQALFLSHLYLQTHKKDTYERLSNRNLMFSIYLASETLDEKE